jgi:hypothetical protein
MGGEKIMKNKIREEIYDKSFDGSCHDVRFSDLPKDIKDDDIIEIIREESFYSENNSWDAFTRLVVIREREETDAEYEKRKLKNKEHKEDLKKRRYDNYVSLKAEFLHEDADLLKIYMSGFNDELDGIPEKKYEDKLSSRAYNLGRTNAIIGDDVRSVDYQSNEELLRQIRL